MSRRDKSTSPQDIEKPLFLKPLKTGNRPSTEGSSLNEKTSGAFPRCHDQETYSKKKGPDGKRRNLGTFSTRDAAEKHEREVQYFKRH